MLPIVLASGLLAQTPALTSEEGQVQKTGSSERLAYVPMTEKDRLQDYLRHMFSPESVLRSAAAAGINQGMNTPSEWHQGAEGYGRRFASAYGTHVVEATVMYGTATVLHEDNRYFRSGLTGFGPRFKYAVASTFLARRDDGSRRLSISRLSSYAAAAAISRSWQPPSTTGPVHAMDAFAISIAAEAGFNVAREFLPGIFRARRPVTTVQNPSSRPPN